MLERRLSAISAQRQRYFPSISFLALTGIKEDTHEEVDRVERRGVGLGRFELLEGRGSICELSMRRLKVRQIDQVVRLARIQPGQLLQRRDLPGKVAVEVVAADRADVFVAAS